jgi:D-3-phosphoglycerate dehydrogenase
MAVTSFPKEQIKVLLLENVSATALEVFARERYQVEVLPGSIPSDELVKRCADVHIVGIRSKTRIEAEVFENAKRLLTVGCFCIGTNQVDLITANRHGVPVFNAPFSNTRSVAELVLAEIIALSRQLGDRIRELHRGVWNKTQAGSHEVRGKTLGIVGYGHIGRQLGVLAEAVGMRVLFYDHKPKLPMGNNRAVESLKDLLERSDFVSLHVPETPQTMKMIGASEIARMQRGACLLNASRGTVVVIDALVEALKTQQLAGAAIDVYPEEPPKNTDAFATTLQGLPNVILTPHVAGSTTEAQDAIGTEVASALVKFVDTGATTGAVNFPIADPPPLPAAHRILNVHKNVPGVLRDINRIVSDLNANIRGQVLVTDPDIGYLIMDLDQDVSRQVKDAVASLETSIRTRILY